MMSRDGDKHAPGLRTDRRLKVLLSAFSCAPGKGSEPGTGWASVQQLSRQHDLWVMVAEAGRPDIEAYVSKSPLPNVTWVFCDLPGWMFFRYFLSRRLLMLYYYLWQIFSYRIARNLHAQVKFDVSLHMTWGCYWRPSFLGRLPVPFVWGPVGGAQTVPRSFYRTLPIGQRLVSQMKGPMEWLAANLDPFVRVTAWNATISIPTTPVGVRKLKDLGAGEMVKLPQLALPDAEIEKFANVPVRENPQTFQLISMGRLLGWKGIHIALQAFARMHKQYPNSAYWHIGEGPMLGRLEAMARELGVSDSFKIIQGCGRQEALDYLSRSDLMLFPSLHDEPGWVVLEGLACGRPVLCVAGVPQGDGVGDACLGTRTDKPEHAISDMADSMLRLAQNPALRIRMGELGRQFVRTHYNTAIWFATISDILRRAVTMGECRRQPRADEKVATV